MLMIFLPFGVLFGLVDANSCPMRELHSSGVMLLFMRWFASL
jgi:hypothetical protein